MTEQLLRKESYRLGEENGYPFSKLEALVGHKLSEAPEHIKGVDYCLHVATLAKTLGKKPIEIASEIKDKLQQKKSALIKMVSTEGPYLNISLKMDQFGKEVVSQILEMGKEYGKEKLGKGKRVVIDMSSPNIAKRMSYGHLRSTIIGDALANLYRVHGFEVIRDNHLGDWGTQFGNLIVAIKHWGDETKLLASKDPIGELQKLYVMFHKEGEKQKEGQRELLKAKVATAGMEAVPGLAQTAEIISEEIMQRKKIGKEELDTGKVLEDALDRVIKTPLEKEGRDWFSKLEKGDPEAKRLWKICVELSIKEFKEIYDVLGVDFELSLGESFYEDQMPGVIEKVKKTNAGKVSEGALVIDMKDKGLDVAIIQKSDGASVYMTRDLATAIYRQRHLKADRAIYVVGEDQKLYFRQLFEILKRIGYPIGARSQHVYFGMVRTPEGKMSTRAGRVILLKDVIKEGLKRVEKIVAEKDPEKLRDNPALRKKVIETIAVGALKWNDLSQNAALPIVFDWDKALNLEGNSAPYVQYAALRARAILTKAGPSYRDSGEFVFNHPAEASLIKKLVRYPQVLREALEASDPSKVATYVYELAQTFNEFYGQASVLDQEEKIKNSRLKLVFASAQVITNGLAILGIGVPETM